MPSKVGEVGAGDKVGYLACPVSFRKVPSLGEWAQEGWTSYAHGLVVRPQQCACAVDRCPARAAERAAAACPGPLRIEPPARRRLRQLHAYQAADLPARDAGPHAADR